MLYNLFPVKIYKKKFSGNLEKLKNSILPQLEKVFEESKNNNQASMRTGGICSFNVFDRLHTQMDLDEITKFAEESATEYWKDLNYVDAKVYANFVWANRYPPGAYIDNHNHIPAPIVGSFYLKKPTNSGNIVFENPISNILRYQPYKGLNVKNDYVSEFDTEVEISEGDLILFPGWLMHRTPLNVSDDIRIILGYNFSFNQTEK